MSTPRLYVDVNVGVDYAANRMPFGKAALAIYSLAENGYVELFTAASTPAFSYYVIEQYLRKTSKLTAKDRIKATYEAIDNILLHTSMVDLNASVVRDAISCEIEDLEDAVQYICAERCKADWILTRDVAGFAGQGIPASTPSDWLDSRKR